MDAEGALRDCGELPASRGDAPELHEYRREAAERERGVRRRAAERERADPPAPAASPAACPEERSDEERDAGDTGVLAARAAPGAGVTRALLALKGRLAAARIAWRTGGGASARGGRLGGATEPGDAPRLAPMSVPRCALGAAELGGRLLVCGGYDRARVLRCAEAYDPDTNTWAALADMRSARGRFPAAVLGGALYALGGSDGHAELDSVDALCGGAWARRARLPLARSHAAAAADERAGALYVAGGWAAGRCLRQVHRYSPLTDTWTEAPPLNTGESVACDGAAPRGARAAQGWLVVCGRAVAVRGRGVAGRAVGAGRLRRVALPGQHGAAARRRLGAGSRAAHGAPLGGRGGVARPAGGGRRFLGRRFAAHDGLAGARRAAVAGRALVARGRRAA